MKKERIRTTLDVDLDRALQSGLRLSEYMFLLLLIRGDIEYIEAFFDTKILGPLIEKGLITSDSKTFTDITLTEKVQTLLEGITLKEEEGLTILRNKYPRAETRHGQRVSLQKNAKGIQTAFHKTIGTSKAKLEEALRALDYILAQREAAGDKAQFLPDLQVWLNQEQWKTYNALVREESKYDGTNLSINL